MRVARFLFAVLAAWPALVGPPPFPKPLHLVRRVEAGPIDISINRWVALSRDAGEALIGASYPNAHRAEHNAMLERVILSDNGAQPLLLRSAACQRRLAGKRRPFCGVANDVPAYASVTTAGA